MKTKQTAERITVIVLAVLVLFGAVSRLIIAAKLPIWGFVPAKQDDALMVLNGWNLYHGSWLGQYNEVILTKGIMYPLLLCVSAGTGISIHIWVMASWILASLLFSIALYPFLKNRILFLLLFGLLLLNPAFSNKYIFLRVYRNSITMTEVLLIFVGAFGCFARYRKGPVRSLPWMLLMAVGYMLLRFTREDSA
ncbi:MAG: hypothetical protein IKS18_05660 [Lachnospiraceae bacterium]|nr:hypothetical protein [Lachnospiraceae bacterium]